MEAITDEIHDTITVANVMFLDMCAQDRKSNSSGITVLHEKCSKKNSKWRGCGETEDLENVHYLRLKKKTTFLRKVQFQKLWCFF
jgi:hypothetical protein